METKEIRIEVVNVGNISDGYHTFDELYDHRIALYVALIKSNPGLSWKSKVHADGKGFGGWFIVGMELPGIGQISYHLPNGYWDDVPAKVLEKGLGWDGHTPKDVVKRLLQFDWGKPSRPK